MKKLMMGSILLMGTVSLALAQTKPPVFNHVSSNTVPPGGIAATPTQGASHVTSNSFSGANNTPTHAFNVQLRKAMETITKDTKSGKLTKAQAQTARGQVKAIRIQELANLKTNGNKQLTSEQLTQLNQSLSQLTPSL